MKEIMNGETNRKKSRMKEIMNGNKRINERGDRKK